MQTDRERQTDRDRQTERQIETESATERERDGEREGETERQRDRVKAKTSREAYVTQTQNGNTQKMKERKKYTQEKFPPNIPVYKGFRRPVYGTLDWTAHPFYTRRAQKPVW